MTTTIKITLFPEQGGDPIGVELDLDDTKFDIDAEPRIAITASTEVGGGTCILPLGALNAMMAQVMPAYAERKQSAIVMPAKPKIILQ